MTSETERRTELENAYEAAIAGVLEIADTLPDTIRDRYPAPDSDGQITWVLHAELWEIRLRLANLQKFISGHDY